MISTEWSLVVVGYLLGSVPFGLVVSRGVYGEDIRRHGSGNVGATNVLRTFGWPGGAGTLLLDALKGVLPVVAALKWAPDQPYLPVAAGAAAIVGHVYPVYLKFDGGKGVATSAGVFGLLAPKALGVAVLLFLAGVGISRYMSAGSLLGAVGFPVAAGYFYGVRAPVTLGAGLVVLLIVWRHRGNLRRLIRGEEHPFF